MTNSAPWVVTHHNIGTLKLRGFKKGKSRWEHARKHYLNPTERWEELAQAPLPEQQRSALRALGHGHMSDIEALVADLRTREVLIQAAVPYVDATREAMVDRKILGAERTRRDGIRCVCMVSAHGVFAAFSAGNPSHLFTWFRPTPRGLRGRPNRALFTQAALRHLQRLLQGAAPARGRGARKGSTGRKGKKMHGHHKYLAMALERALDNGVNGPDELLDMMISGEELRRALFMSADEEAGEERGLLHRYDAQLASYGGELPQGLDATLDGALDDLAALAAAEPRLEDEHHDNERCLAGVEEVLSVAAGLHRAGKLDGEAVASLAERAARGVAQLAAELPALWELSLRRLEAQGVDPDLPGLLAFLEPLADYSSERLEVRRAANLMPAERRRAMIDAAVEHLAAESVLDRLKQWLTELGDVVVPAPAGLAQESYDAGAAGALADREIILERDGFCVLRTGAQLELLVSGPHRKVEVPGARLADGTALVVAQPADDHAIVELGPGALPGARIQLHVRLDNADLDFPEITLTNGTT